MNVSSLFWLGDPAIPPPFWEMRCETYRLGLILCVTGAIVNVIVLVRLLARKGKHQQTYTMRDV